MSRLAPLCEEPVDEDDIINNSRKNHSWKNWLKTQFFSFAYNKKTNLKILLSVLGCPLFPISINPKLATNEVSSAAQYIVQHFTAATGCRKLEGRVKNYFATGKVVMAMMDELGPGGTASSTTGVSQQKGCFVIWQMVPNNWLIELAVDGQKVVAGSNGHVAWRYTPWLGAHAAKGGIRPLRRAVQGLDPQAIAALFSAAQYMGEKNIMDTDCFVLKLSADQTELADRSDTTAEMIKHTVYGYFSQRSGLLVYLEDSYLTRIQSPGTHPMYWETTMGSKIEDYHLIDGVMIAHSGQSSVMITRFGDDLKAGPAVSRLEETWVIDDFMFNVPGVCMDSFIPPNNVCGDRSSGGLARKLTVR